MLEWYAAYGYKGEVVGHVEAKSQKEAKEIAWEKWGSFYVMNCFPLEYAILIEE